MFLCNISLSLENKYFTNYADDTASYVIGSNPEEVASELKDLTQKLLGLPKTKGKLTSVNAWRVIVLAMSKGSVKNWKCRSFWTLRARKIHGNIRKLGGYCQLVEWKNLRCFKALAKKKFFQNTSC